MRRVLRIVVVLAGAAVVAAGLSQAPRGLARLETFRVQAYALEGSRFLSTDEAAGWADLPPGASVWDDPAPWEERLAAHPLIESVEVRRDLPHTVVFRIRERRPVALVPRPTLEPVDADGRTLPLDPAAHRFDLPVIRPRVDGTGRTLTEEEVRTVSMELARLASVDPAFLATVSDAVLGGHGDITAALIDPPVRLVFRPPLTPLRLRDGLQAAADAGSRVDDGTIRRVDLRYDDQVVVELGRTLTSRLTD